MGEVYFYHLTRRSAEETLPPLLSRALAQGWRVAIRGTDAARLAALDTALWRGPPDAFQPHGLAGGPHDAAQPVLLTAGDAANDPACLMAMDGADVAPDEVAAMARTCILFDGRDAGALARARAQWSTLTEAGCGARYWSEEGGTWAQKASRNV